MKTLLILLCLFLPFQIHAATKEINISLGESTHLPLRAKSSVWIQDRAILKADSTGGRLTLKGAQEGMTTVRIDQNLYRIQVIHPEKRAQFANLKKSISKIIGLSIEVGEGDLIITGRLYRMSDWIRLAELVDASGISYQMRASLSASLQSESQQYFSTLFSKARIPPQTVIFLPSAEVRVSGNDLILAKYKKLLRPYGIAIIKDQTSLEIAPTVKVQITVAELRRSNAVNFGIRWPEAYNASILPDGNVAFAENPFSIHAFEQKGFGKILASPNIICRSGSEAEFLAGGEFPIKIMNYKIQDIVWKRYGILLRVKPKADSTGRISLSIETEVSTLDNGRAVDGIPGILTNRVSSHFDLTRPQTIALSGLLQNEEGRGSNGLPMLSRIPILGALFASKDYKENRSELVIFVRPSIMTEGDDNDSSPQHVGDIRRNL
ncbi:pilus assembly protein [Bdellovibrio sp. HCB209]|uniref:pilus assembly protein n=1 Tax=Bdellovibrio sp. HCB209 TaxID=3394354 RepID=UPI0039B637B1